MKVRHFATIILSLMIMNTIHTMQPHTNVEESVKILQKTIKQLALRIETVQASIEFSEEKKSFSQEKESIVNYCYKVRSIAWWYSIYHTLGNVTFGTVFAGLVPWSITVLIEGYLLRELVHKWRTKDPRHTNTQWIQKTRNESYGAIMAGLLTLAVGSGNILGYY